MDGKSNPRLHYSYIFYRLRYKFSSFFCSSRVPVITGFLYTTCDDGSPTIATRVVILFGSILAVINIPRVFIHYL